MTESAWPPVEGVSTPTVSGQESVFAVTSSAQINAPASFIFEILLDTSNYSQWCTFVPKVIIDAHPPSDGTHHDGDMGEISPLLKLGTKFTFFAVMGHPGSKQTPTHLIVSDMSTPSNPSSYIPATALEASAVYTEDLSKVHRVAWKGDKIDFFAKGLNTERFHEVITQGQEQCEVRTWEVMGGVLAHTVKWLYRKTLDKKFDEWCADLKVFGEKEWVESKQAMSNAGAAQS